MSLVPAASIVCMAVGVPIGVAAAHRPKLANEKLKSVKTCAIDEMREERREGPRMGCLNPAAYNHLF